MYLSISLITVWMVATVASIAISMRWAKRSQKRQATIKQLKRTVDKLQRENGRLWYDLMKVQGTDAGSSRQDLTSTNL